MADLRSNRSRSPLRPSLLKEAKTAASEADLKSVDRQQTAAAKAKAMGSSISRRQAHASIIQSSQNMVKQGQKMLEVAAHEHAAGRSLIAAGEALAATIPAPEMPPNATAIVPVAP